MVRHIVYGNQLVLLRRDSADDVFLDFVVVFGWDEVLPAFDSEYDVNINLRIGVGHARKMPLLTELENPFRSGFYIDAAPTVLKDCFRLRFYIDAAPTELKDVFRVVF